MYATHGWWLPVELREDGQNPVANPGQQLQQQQQTKPGEVATTTTHTPRAVNDLFAVGEEYDDQTDL